ncbi:MAG: hypothetical protein L7U46_09285 [Candidatus Nanopelagicales bacterium]|nr:hypothetical protein [Candidatus Nanopelagicales bacterium]
MDRRGLDKAASDLVTTRLLHDMGEFVGEKFLPRARTKAGGIPKEDIRTDGESAGLEAIVEVGCFGAGMEPHMREVGPKPCAHVGSHVIRQGLTTTATALDPLLRIRVDRSTRMSHNCVASNAPSWRTADIGRLRVTMLGNPPPDPANDLFGNGVGLTLGGIVG